MAAVTRTTTSSSTPCQLLSVRDTFSCLIATPLEYPKLRPSKSLPNLHRLMRPAYVDDLQLCTSAPQYHSLRRSKEPTTFDNLLISVCEIPAYYLWILRTAYYSPRVELQFEDSGFGLAYLGGGWV